MNLRMQYKLFLGCTLICLIDCSNINKDKFGRTLNVFEYDSTSFGFDHSWLYSSEHEVQEFEVLLCREKQDNCKRLFEKGHLIHSDLISTRVKVGFNDPKIIENGDFSNLRIDYGNTGIDGGIAIVKSFEISGSSISISEINTDPKFKKDLYDVVFSFTSNNPNQSYQVIFKVIN